LGDAYRKMVDGGNAIISYDKALELDSTLAKAMYRKGMIYKTQNQPSIYIDRFTKAVAIDSNYTPALYELYYYYYFRDVVTADKFLNAYIRNADPDPQHAYMLTDLHYVSQKYNEAIRGAKDILNEEGDSAQPRLYKLIAYSYAALGDSASALNYINSYFDKQTPSEFVAKDFELKANLLEKSDPDKSLAIVWYKKALAADTSTKERLNYMITLADLQKELGNREREAIWRENIYNKKGNPTNLDLYKWGIALYGADNFEKADSVFTIYEKKYPDEVHGYLWRAMCNALIDSNMEKGLAVPHYLKLAEIAATDSVKNKSLLIRAYKYLAAYEANITRNYTASLEYYDKILALNPEDSNTEKNLEILGKLIAKSRNSN
jgi:tetratricopeptide (TPR) repeat protein